MKEYCAKLNIRTVDGVSTPSTWGLQSIDKLLSYRAGKGLESLFNTIYDRLEDKVQINVLDLRIQGPSILHYLFSIGATQFINPSEYYFSSNNTNYGKTESRPVNYRNYFINNGLVSGIYATQDFTYFDASIGDLGQYYNFKVFIGKKDREYKEITIMDISKVLINTTYKKLKEEFLNENYIEELEEMQKLRQDIETISRSVKLLREWGLKESTAAGCALSDFKKRLDLQLGQKNSFDILFPKLEQEEVKFCYSGYRGGFCYLNPDYASKEVRIEEVGDTVITETIWKDIGGKGKLCGAVLDFNAMYTSVMKSELLPIGKPKKIIKHYDFLRALDYQYDEFTGKKRFIYIKRFICNIKLKQGGLPFIQLKNIELNQGYNFETEVQLPPNEHIVESGCPIEITLTDVDEQLLYDNYDVWDYDFVEAYLFECSDGIFDDYIDKWYGLKVQGKKEKNTIKKEIGKIMDNALSGKFGAKPLTKWKIPYIKNGVIQYRYTKVEENKTVYMPMSVFITSYARQKLFNFIRNYEVEFKKYCKELKYKDKIVSPFIYSDTDSAHIVCNENILQELKEIGVIDEFELGKLKVENLIYKARYIRNKTYLQEVDNKGTLKVVCSGLPVEAQDNVNFDNFTDDFVFKGKKKVYAQGIGGMVEVYQDFKIRGL